MAWHYKRSMSSVGHALHKEKQLSISQFTGKSVSQRIRDMFRILSRNPLHWHPARPLTTSLLQDLYPDIFRFTVSLFPSRDDDVVTSPYNSVLALSELIDHASAVLPIDNQALLDIVSMVDKKSQPKRSLQAADDTAKHLLGAGVSSVCFHCAACGLCEPGLSSMRSSPCDFI